MFPSCVAATLRAFEDVKRENAPRIRLKYLERRPPGSTWVRRQRTLLIAFFAVSCFDFMTLLTVVNCLDSSCMFCCSARYC